MRAVLECAPVRGGAVGLQEGGGVRGGGVEEPALGGPAYGAERKVVASHVLGALPELRDAGGPNRYRKVPEVRYAGVILVFLMMSACCWRPSASVWLNVNQIPVGGFVGVKCAF